MHLEGKDRPFLLDPFFHSHFVLHHPILAKDLSIQSHGVSCEGLDLPI